MTIASLQELLEATSPQTRARQRETTVIPVAEELAPLLPDGGLVRGTATEVGDAGLLIQLAARHAAHRGVWSAVVDIPDFGDQAATSAGMPPGRLVHVPDSQDKFADVLLALVPAFQLIICRRRRVPGFLPHPPFVLVGAWSVGRRMSGGFLAGAPWSWMVIRLRGDRDHCSGRRGLGGLG